MTDGQDFDADGTKEKMVKFDTYDKAMKQIGKLRQEMEAYQSQIAEIELRKQEEVENSLKKAGKVEELLKLKEAELERVKKEELTKEREEKEKALKMVQESERRILEAKKLSAFTERLPAKIKRKEYYSLVNLDAVTFDENGQINETELEGAVSQFIANYSDLLDMGRSGGGLPVGGGRGSYKKGLSYEEWKKLPYSEMERRKNEVID